MPSLVCTGEAGGSATSRDFFFAWNNCIIRASLAMTHSAGSNWGVAKLVKAPDFDSGIRRFESFFPSQSVFFKPGR